MAHTVRSREALYTRRTSRQMRTCQYDSCRAEIKPGDLYYRAALPPFTGVNSGHNWWVMVLCETCGTLQQPQEESDD